MSDFSVGLIGIAVLFALLSLKVPIGFAMAAVGFVGFAILTGIDGALSALALIPYRVVTNYYFAVIPLFLAMSALAVNSGITRDLYASAYKWVGQYPGGLVSATVLASGGFAAVTGSSMAGTVAMGKIVAPEIQRYNYEPRFVSGAVAAGGTLGILIPPSMGFILYGILTEQSIGQLFIAGIFPGILEVLFYLVVIFILCRLTPSIGPAGPKVSFKAKLTSSVGLLPVAALFALVMGGIYGGIFTPTEAGGIGAFGALVIGLGRRGLTGKGFVNSLTETAMVTSRMIALLMGAFIFAGFLSLSRIPFDLAEAVANLAIPPYAIIAIILFAYILLGCAFDLLSIIVITVPIIFPIVTSLGLHPIWFGVLVVRVLEVGAITPPIGINTYVLAGVMNIPASTIFRGIIPFVIADLFHIAILVAIPQISLFLPNLMIASQ